MKRLAVIMLASAVLCAPSAADEQPEKQPEKTPAEKTETVDGHNILVSISKLRSDKGLVLISLFNSADGFPGDKDKAFRVARLPVLNGKSSVTFEKIPAGTWAIAVVHDENGNNKMDRKIFGMPAEGIGVSGKPRPMMGPPRFKPSSFKVTSDTKVKIKMKYF